MVGELPSSEGVRQGDVIGASLFALAVQPLFARCVRNLPRVKAVAILDDYELEGPPTDVLQALATVRKEAAAVGLGLVLSKCKALWPREAAPSSEIVRQILDSGLTLVYGSMDSLGALVGSDDVATSKWALEKAQSHDQLFAALLHPALPVQHAMGILRFCAIPRMNYLTRVVRPDLLRPACEYFDRKVFETALTKLGLPSTLTDEAHTLLTQPIRLGGFGLRPMVRVSPAAYWSSVSQAAPDISSLIQTRLVAPSSVVASPRSYWIADCSACSSRSCSSCIDAACLFLFVEVCSHG